MRMLYCPFRSPRSGSSLWEGGSRRSVSTAAATTLCSLIRARRWISGGKRRTRCPSNSLRVSSFLNRFTDCDNNAIRYECKVTDKKVDIGLHCLDALEPEHRLAGSDLFPTMPFKAFAVRTVSRPAIQNMTREDERRWLGRLSELEYMHGSGLRCLRLAVHQESDLLRSLAAEGLFSTTGADGNRNPIHKDILSIDLKDFSRQFVSALLRMTDRARRHSCLGVEVPVLHKLFSLAAHTAPGQPGTG